MLDARDILGEGGLVARKLAGYESRPQQLEMALAVEAALREGRHLLVEAGTGVGKSFAYLVPAIQLALSLPADERPVVVSTGTIALQQQLYGKDIPFLRSVMPDEFTAVLAKGRSNYISLRRLEVALRGQGGHFLASDEARELARIKAWSEHTPDGTRATLEFEPSSEAWQQVVSERTNCMGRQCPNYESRCFFQRARRRIYNAHVLIVNHALLCADLALKAAGVNYLPDYRHVIIDEAHDLEAYASDHLGLRLTRQGWHFALAQVYNARKDTGLLSRFDFLRGAHEALRQTRDEGERFFTAVETWARGQRERPARVHRADQFPLEVCEFLRKLALALKDGMLSARTEDERLEIEHQVARMNELAGSIETWVGQGLDGQVYWVALQDGPRRENVELHSAPVEVGPTLENLLFKRCRSVILTSATLATGKNDFSYVRSRLGVPEGEASRELQVGSPFDYRNLAGIVIPDVPEPPRAGGHDPEYDSRIADEVLAAVKRSRGGTFVLFTSQAQMRKVHEAVAPRMQLLGYRVLRQGDGLSRERMLEQFQQGDERKQVLFGLETFWQGVDVPGDALTTVVLVRLPFPVPTDPLVAARMDAIVQAGGNDFNDFMVPEATIKLRQGFGRLIRRKDDSGTVVILDSRVVRKPYGKRMLAALPECPITDGAGGDPLAKRAKSR